MYVSLANLPSPPTKYQKTITSFHGGMNTAKAPNEIADHQCAELKNVIWQDGVLRSRRGLQNFGNMPTDYEGAKAIALHKNVWNGLLVIASMLEDNLLIFGVDSDSEDVHEAYKLPVSEKIERGSFFEFGDSLYFKAKNQFIKIEYDENTLSAATVSAYIPITHINLNKNGVGDLYQPVNRLNAWREVWFDIDDAIEYTEFACDGQTKTFYLPSRCPRPSDPQDEDLMKVVEVYLGANLLQEGSSNGNYSVNLNAGSITIIGDAPPLGLKLSVKMLLHSFVYRLPEGEKAINNDIAPQMQVFVKDLQTGEYTEYSYSSEVREKNFGYSDGMVVFENDTNVGGENAYKYDANVRSRGIKVRYAVDNEEKMLPIAQCSIATTYGASGIEQNCVVMAGYDQQPNAFFWSGNDGSGANPTYFPVSNYNIVGSSNDPITVFGRQQNKLVIFQKNRLSSATFGLTDINGRSTVTLNTKTINENIGCDYPGSVQLIENNLVWAHSKHGVMYLKDSTYAYETLVACISGNINANSKVSDQQGLISALANDGRTIHVSSFDDGSRYWLCISNGFKFSKFIWDYSLQSYTNNTEKLCWFYADGVNAFAWATGNDAQEVFGVALPYTKEHLLFRFEDATDDFGMELANVIQTKSFDFGVFNNTKNIETVIFNMDCSKETYAKVQYITDNEKRLDETIISSGFETDDAAGHYAVFERVRKPKCRKIRRFAIRLNNNRHDLNLLSVQIMYTVNGRNVKAGKSL